MTCTSSARVSRVTHSNENSLGHSMRQKRIAFLSLFLLAIAVHGASAQGAQSSLAEKLGFPRDAKLLIVHADDVGVTHSVNAATIQGLESGLVNSASLMVQNGYFHHDWKPTTRINPKEVDLELRAQIDRAYAMGLRPTHLDSHQYRLFDNGKGLFKVVVRIAHEYHLPVFVARDWFAERPYLEKSLGPADIVIDHTITIAPGVAPDKWADF